MLASLGEVGHGRGDDLVQVVAQRLDRAAVNELPSEWALVPTEEGGRQGVPLAQRQVDRAPWT